MKKIISDISRLEMDNSAYLSHGLHSVYLVVGLSICNPLKECSCFTSQMMIDLEQFGKWCLLVLF